MQFIKVSPGWINRENQTVALYELSKLHAESVWTGRYHAAAYKNELLIVLVFYCY